MSGRRLTVLVTSLVAALAATAAQAGAAAPAPHWNIVAQAEPTYFHAGDPADAYRLIVRNDGAAATTPGATVSISDTLPAGVRAVATTGRGEAGNGSGLPPYPLACPTGEVTGTVTCTYGETPTEGRILPGSTIVITITVAVPEGAIGEMTNTAAVSGGGAPSAQTVERTPLDRAEPPPFGLAYMDMDVADQAGEGDLQAGSHPFEITANFGYDIDAREAAGLGKQQAPLSRFSTKDMEVALPAGLVGDANAVPRCSQQEFQLLEGLECPLATQVGTLRPLFYGHFPSATYPVYNIAPPPGEPAELGVSIAHLAHIPIFFHVRSDGDYGLTLRLDNLPEGGPLQGGTLTLWGVPADASHDLEREGTVGQGRQQQEEFCKPLAKVEGGVETQTPCPSAAPARAFLTLPGTCTGQPLQFGVARDAWQPAPPVDELVSALPSGLTGCDRLPFAPTVSVTPEVTMANAPSGYRIDLHLPQSEDPAGLATADIKRATVTLPPGVALAPPVASGLQACPVESAGACPAASQVGTVALSTPLLPAALEGGVFLGKPLCGPCTPADAQSGRLLPVIVQAQGSGVTVTLHGSLSVNQSTGSVTADIEQAPQLPFEDLTIKLNGGPRAPLANPDVCGDPLAGFSQLIPYSGQPPAEPAGQPFVLSGCPAPRFAPAFVGGTRENRAGATTGANALTMTFSRSDADQLLGGVSVRLPAGLTAALSKVTPCVEPYVRALRCGPQSEIGSTTIALGLGSEPYFVTGRVYLTSAYGAGPFGLSIVVPMLAGPLDLGTVNIRAAIEVDPATAALTIRSDRWPTSIDGIPLQIKMVNVTIDRAGLIVNPTSCARMSVAARLQSAQGAAAAVASSYQAAGCASLRFAPRLTALTHAGMSTRLGVYLHAKLVAARDGANIGKLTVDLPHTIVPRLATVQKACRESTLAATPASCATVGNAVVVTPLLRNALSGQVYVVSRGAKAMPLLSIILRGEGITLRVDGQVSVTKGRTAVAFRSLPDLPISSLDLVLRSGAGSLLTPARPMSPASVCRHGFSMPIALTAQNGDEVARKVSIAISGCPRRHARRR